MDGKERCGGCLWYGTPDRTNKLGECQNSASLLYWDRGTGRPLHVGSKQLSCEHYKSVRAFLGEEVHEKRWGQGFVAMVSTGLYELAYPIAMTALFFFYAFHDSPETYDSASTSSELQKLQ